MDLNSEPPRILRDSFAQEIGEDCIKEFIRRGLGAGVVLDEINRIFRLTPYQLWTAADVRAVLERPEEPGS